MPNAILNVLFSVRKASPTSAKEAQNRSPMQDPISNMNALRNPPATPLLRASVFTAPGVAHINRLNPKAEMKRISNIERP